MDFSGMPELVDQHRLYPAGGYGGGTGGGGGGYTPWGAPAPEVGYAPGWPPGGGFNWPPMSTPAPSNWVMQTPALTATSAPPSPWHPGPGTPINNYPPTAYAPFQQQHQQQQQQHQQQQQPQMQMVVQHPMSAPGMGMSWSAGAIAGLPTAGMFTPKTQLRRTNSYSGLDANELARRPGDWRYDYRPRGGLSSLFGRRRSVSISKLEGFQDPVKRKLHPFLNYDGGIVPIYYDLRDDPMRVQFLSLDRAFNHLDVLQYVTDPPCQTMRVTHHSFPWFIDIYAVPNPNMGNVMQTPGVSPIGQPTGSGVTIHDFFDQLNDQLHQPISRRHYYNEELSEDDRRKLDLAYKERCEVDQGLLSQGIKRLDFLKGKVYFEGLVRGRNGTWEMKLKRR